MENINWYPGHMKKTKDLIQENLKLVDVVVEVIDARIPVSSRNPMLGSLVSGKTRVVVLNKSDLSDPQQNLLWQQHFEKEGQQCLVMNCEQGDGAKQLIKLLTRIMDKKNEGRERKRPLRLMIVGIPNVGKSSLINRLTNSKGAKTGNKPGVTRGKQWLTLGANMMLLDTPGILWPKFEDPNVGLDLAFCGAIRDEIMDLATLGLDLIKRLSEVHPDLLMARYRIGQIEETPLMTMEAIARKRGFILKGAEIDYERTARTVIDEFRGGKIGRITLEIMSAERNDESGL